VRIDEKCHETGRVGVAVDGRHLPGSIGTDDGNFTESAASVGSLAKSIGAKFVPANRAGSTPPGSTNATSGIAFSDGACANYTGNSIAADSTAATAPDCAAPDHTAVSSLQT
jgi:hypothetical protein